ncbi:two-component regulator propeller domain-containing protein [Fluviicola sp.]|uniref:two-component regulator propeller domain-containing protein n=1 Tax=Fluviicola sp. TaxID=1917219 RepID=UPI0031D8DBF8
MLNRISLAGLLVFGIIQTLSAQLYNIKSYTDDNGLAQNYVYSMSQNENGFLLIGTGDGFNVFEGDKFKTFTVKNGLAENFVTAHATFGKKTIIGHFQGGITIYENNRFKKIKKTELENVKVNGFVQDKNGDILIYTQGKGLFKFNQKKQLIPLENPLANGINQVEYDHANDYLIGTSDGLVVMNYDNLKNPREIESPEELKYKTISRIVKGNKQGSLFWIGVEGEGVYGIIRKGRSYRIVSFFGPEKLGITEGRMTSMICDRENNLWLGFLGEGIRRITFTGSDKNSFFIKKIDAANGIDNLNIQQIFQDNEGNMWFGTFGGGLYLKTIQPFVYYNEKNGLKNTNIRAVTTVENNVVWLGSEKGLCSYNLVNNEITVFNKSNGFINDEVTCLRKGYNGILWIGTKNSGTFTYDLSTRKFAHFSKEHGLRLNCINSIDQTAYGIVYIGTTDGLYICDTKKNTQKWLTTLEGLMHNNVRDLFVDSQNRLWIGSPGTPPYHYKNGKFKAYKDIEGLKNYKIVSYAEDRGGAVWIATEGDGVFRFKDGKFKNFTISNGLKSNYIYGILYDGGETIWLTHKDGMTKLNTLTFKAAIVDKGRGNLKFRENNTNSFYRENNTLFFGTTSGLIVYSNPVNGAGQLALTSICDITFDGKSAFGNNPISLKYKRYNVTVRYKGIAFSDQRSVEYKYRLIGLDDSWRSTSNDFVDFPKLDDGTYTFELLASNPQGTWTKKPVKITFEIRSPYWKQWWFYVLLAAVFFLIVWLVIRVRINALREAKLKLEKIVARKTRELQEEKDVIEQIKDELQDKNKNITDSINYALRIQKAILPDEGIIKNNFPDSTIFYQPRDIVSGDFYWFAENEKYSYYAMVDCTGHGIPGAFMSLIGSTLLNEIVTIYKLETPAEILLQLHKMIIKTLKQDQNPNSRDGMDMILCRFDKKSSQVMFSSAGRPLFHVSEGKLETYRGLSFSIGGSYDYLDKNFLNQEITTKKGDLLIMFSDGYSDQFGEAIPKKFSTKRVKKLCEQMTDLPADHRNKLIEKTFFSWKGDAEQIDDVLFITVKID